MIENVINFKYDTAYKINKITLEDVRIYNNDTIAVLSYYIKEYIEGVTIQSSNSKEQLNATKKLEFNG